MILNEIEVQERMESPLNLLNRLRSQGRKSYQDNTGNVRNQIVSLPPTVNQLVENIDEKLGFGGIKNKATSIMLRSLEELENRLPEIQRPERLANVAEQMAKVVNAVSPKDHNDDRKMPQIVIYAPAIRHERDYKVIDISASE